LEGLDFSATFGEAEKSKVSGRALLEVYVVSIEWLKYKDLNTSRLNILYGYK